MNCLLVEPSELQAGNRLLVEDRRAEHIVRVLASRVGDTLRAGMVGGAMGTARIVELSAERLRPRVVLELDLGEEPPPRPGIDLVLALPRQIMLRRILFQAATMGVDRIFLINAARVEKSFFKASILAPEMIREQFLLGLEQGRDTVLPELSVHPRFRAFVEDQLPGLAAGIDCRLVAHPGTEHDLAGVTCGRSGRLLLAVGPEGGWVEFEIERFREQGFAPFHMGPRILRVDTAVVALLGQCGLVRQLQRAAG